MGNHVHNWKSLQTEYPKFCACGAMRVPSMHSGERSIEIAAGSADLIRWSATQAALALGDIGMNTTSGRPSMFVGGSARDWADSAPDNDTAPGLGLYGSGSDGSPSSPLTSNTTLSSDDTVVRFTNLDLDGFSLTGNSADTDMMLYVSGTLTMASGIISPPISGTNPAGGAGGGAAGDGGDGGDTRHVLYLYANTISGTGTIRANGENGSNGVNGAASSSTANGSSGTAANSALVLFNVQVGQSAFGGNNAFSNAGGGSRTSVAVNGRTESLARDMLRWFYFGVYPTAGTTVNQRRGLGSQGAGGGGASDRNGAITAGGGGGAAAGGTFLGRGGTGGGGGNGIGATGGAGGGGGGGSATGGLIQVATETQSGGTLTIEANGGDGGDGGDAGTGNAGNGGGAGGAGGGVALFVGPPNATVTMTASAGTAGVAGTGGQGGSAGTDGNDGLTMEIDKES